ncbi:HHIP-like protein 2 isoform X2 [Nematostella vectensis]|uniref:HHIP-like protein 2 isoform X2 n=1 Tax=Nematostella vectensis TaxID=45351 RepID=UPI001390041D|nr:HHIP-like protein 2 isoform X2 [Nematostella vectensis]
MKEFQAVAVLCLLMCLRVCCHPQCLDYRPPFKAREGLAFCSQYNAFGCCTRGQDSKISRRYQNLVTKFKLHARVKCAKLLAQVLCLECDPYAAHIFEAEGNSRFDIKTATPGLCHEFCLDFHNSCEDVVTFMERRGKWVHRGRPSPVPPLPVNETAPTLVTTTSQPPAHRFCHNIRLQDTDYCYPAVKTVEERVLARKFNKEKNEGCLCAEEVARGLRNPIAAVHSKDGTHRLFIAEQLGVIRVLLHTGQLLARPFLDITDKVLTSENYADERGLLSIEFHPNYVRNGKFYVYYSTFKDNKTRPDNDEPFWGHGHKTVLSEFLVSNSDPNRADGGSERVILEIPQPALNHNGGQIMFDDKGYLYLSLGDGGMSGDPFGTIGNGQNMSNILGTIIRIDINTRDGSAYDIPRDNPFRDMFGVRPEIWAYGVRNMWRCSMDRGDKITGYGRGRMFCGDVGQFKFEEIDIIERGRNYGWRGFEGFDCFDRDLCYTPMLSNAIFPIHAYNHTVGKSVLGGYVYRGCQSPNLYGQYIFADTWSSRFFSLTENRRRRRWDHREICFGDDKYCTDRMRGDFEQFVLSFGEDEAGELYLLAVPTPKAYEREGKIYRLIDPERRGSPSECSFTPVPPRRLTVKRKKHKPCRDTLMSVYPQTTWGCGQYRAYCNLPFIKKHCKKSCRLCDKS